MRRQSVGGYPGICRVHRAELKRLHGRWSEAEQEARQACVELERFGLLDAVGYAQYEVGEVRLRMGDLDAAGEAFDRAYEYGHDAQPGIALLHLARGEIDEAARRSDARSPRRPAAREPPTERPGRACSLPRSTSRWRPATWRRPAQRSIELESIATDFQRPVFEAGALTARGELLLGEDRPAEASPLLGRSWRLWQDTDLPYESARARLRYAEAGRPTATRRPLAGTCGLPAACSSGSARGSTSHGSTRSWARRPNRRSRATQRVTTTFMFTDIVTSTDLVGLIGDDAWGDLLQWHDRELRSAFANHRGEEVKHTGDGFFVAFERADRRARVRVDIQRRLARHRHEHGFAPTVRIGLHTAEAIARGRRLPGPRRARRRAHRCGRDDEEILVSSAALGEMGSVRFGLSDPRQLTLKGVDEPVEVRSVDWR